MKKNNLQTILYHDLSLTLAIFNFQKMGIHRENDKEHISEVMAMQMLLVPGSRLPMLY